jgi:hypothetical protein
MPCSAIVVVHCRDIHPSLLQQSIVFFLFSFFIKRLVNEITVGAVGLCMLDGACPFKLIFCCLVKGR